jgi:uncharacterized protein (TIGR02996 family)
MVPAFPSEEEAFWRAIQSAPADDAPWLVYADWLDEHGQESNATFIRQFLPNVRNLIMAGLEPAVVMDMVARQEPAIVDSNLAKQPSPPQANEPETDPQLEGHLLESGARAPQILWIIPAVLIGLVCYVGAQQKVRYSHELPPSSRVEPPEDYTKLLPIIQETLRAHRVLYPGVPWQLDEVAGHTYLRVGQPGLFILAFASDSKAILVSWENVGFGFPWFVGGKWSIDEQGILRVAATEGMKSHSFRKVSAGGNRYRLFHAGQSEEYLRGEFLTNRRTVPVP